MAFSNPSIWLKLFLIFKKINDLYCGWFASWLIEGEITFLRFFLACECFRRFSWNVATRWLVSELFILSILVTSRSKIHFACTSSPVFCTQHKFAHFWAQYLENLSSGTFPTSSVALSVISGFWLTQGLSWPFPSASRSSLIAKGRVYSFVPLW